MTLLPLQTPVLLPERGIRGRITGYEWVDGVFAHYAVEYLPPPGDFPRVAFEPPERVRPARRSTGEGGRTE